MDNLKVGAAATLGIVVPETYWAFGEIEPWLKLVLLACQVGVAIATIIYIYYKIQKLK